MSDPRDLTALSVAMSGIGSHADPCRLPDTHCLCGVVSAREDARALVNALIAAHTSQSETATKVLFTVDEVIQIANETSDSFGNLYRLDFIDRMRHEARLTPGNSGEKTEAVTELEVWGNGCECWVTPEHMWTTHYGAVEPGSQVEFNPNCPQHGNPDQSPPGVEKESSVDKP